MAQDRAQVALAPFLALCKSATSPRAASDLITQATSASGTYTFADLLAQPNIIALAKDSQYGGHHKLLEIFAWGTWETYNSTAGLPKLSDPQILKLRLLSLLSYAAEKQPDLSYSTLCKRLQLSSAVDLEHLVTTAIYSDLLTATLDPAEQLVRITSVAPVRDLAPGSITDMLQELEQWSTRCDSVLADLESEISKIKYEASMRAAKQQADDAEHEAAVEAHEKTAGASQSQRGVLPKLRGQGSVLDDADLVGDGDPMEIDGQAAGGKKKGASRRMKGK